MKKIVFVLVTLTLPMIAQATNVQATNEDIQQADTPSIADKQTVEKQQAQESSDTKTTKQTDETQELTEAFGRMTIDKIVVRVNGVNILQSDLEQPQITREGKPFSLDEAIVYEILYQRAAEMHMLPSTTEIERHLVAFKMQNNFVNMSDRQFEDELKRNGFTLKSYKLQLGKMIAVENVRRAEISEKIVVTTQEVENYYNNNPKYTKEKYHLQVCSIPTDQLSKKDTLLKKGKLTWEDLGWVTKDDIGKKFTVVLSMQKGETSEPIKTDDTTSQIVKVLDKQERRLKTLDERYRKIEFQLQQERKDECLAVFEKELKEKAALTYFD